MMFPETQRQVEQKLEHVYGFKRKPSTNGDKLRGRCPDCNTKSHQLGHLPKNRG